MGDLIDIRPFCRCAICFCSHRLKRLGGDETCPLCRAGRHRRAKKVFPLPQVIDIDDNPEPDADTWTIRRVE